jgi:hypothetical protein
VSLTGTASCWYRTAHPTPLPYHGWPHWLPPSASHRDLWGACPRVHVPGALLPRSSPASWWYAYAAAAGRPGRCAPVATATEYIVFLGGGFGWGMWVGRGDVRSCCPAHSHASARWPPLCAWCSWGLLGRARLMVSGVSPARCRCVCGLCSAQGINVGAGCVGWFGRPCPGICRVDR